MNWFHEIISEAAKIGASDIHLTAGSTARFRLDKGLVASKSMTQKLHPGEIDWIVQSLLTTPQKDVLNRDHYVMTAYTHEEIGRGRLAVSRQRGSQYIHLKIINENASLKGKHFPETIEKLYGLKSGLVLLTGSARSGKATTAAKILHDINQNACKNIVTIEQNIAYLLKHERSIVKQKEVGLDVNSHLEGLSFSLSEDADVIYLDEVPDNLTLRKALVAAEQGKLVILSLHCVDVQETVQYILGTFHAAESNHAKLQFANVLKGIIAHRSIQLENGGSDTLYEVLLGNKATKRVILENKLTQLREIMDHYVTMGMGSFDYYLAKLVISKRIDRDTAIQMAVKEEQVIQHLNRGVAQ